MKRIGYIVIPLLLILFIFFLSSKEQTLQDHREEINLAVKEKVDDYISSRRSECLEEVMKEADRRADSVLQIVALEMFSQKIDVDSARLFRPKVPEITVDTDSIPIEPLFRDSIQN